MGRLRPTAARSPGSRNCAPARSSPCSPARASRPSPCIGLRYAGDPRSAPLAAGESRLILETARGPAFVPSGVGQGGRSNSSPRPSPAGNVSTTFATLPPADKELATDTSTVWALVFALQFLLADRIRGGLGVPQGRRAEDLDRLHPGRHPRAGSSCRTSARASSRTCCSPNLLQLLAAQPSVMPRQCAKRRAHPVLPPAQVTGPALTGQALAGARTGVTRPRPRPEAYTGAPGHGDPARRPGSAGSVRRGAAALGGGLGVYPSSAAPVRELAGRSPPSRARDISAWFGDHQVLDRVSLDDAAPGRSPR